MKTALKVFEPNMLGRDFAIGDLHGAYSAYENLLKNLDFDEEKDRMFSVGDPVDRGPDSLKCLQLIRKPYFHQTLCNHGQMMIEAFTGGRMGAYWLYNGGAWGAEALVAWKETQAGKQTHISDEDAEIFDLVNLLDEVPYLITVNNRNGKKFHIMHAELPPMRMGMITDEILADEEQVRKLAMTQAGDGDAFLWSRHLFQTFSRIHLDKTKCVNKAKNGKLLKYMNDERSMIISGHSILTKPLTLIGQTNIDTCAYGSCEEGSDDWCALTCINLDTWQFYQATPTTFKEVEPITVNKIDLDPTESDHETDPRS